MHVRTSLVTLLAAAGLAAAATAGQAVAPAAVTFSGRISVTPTVTAQPRTVEFCFYGGLTCGNTATPNGTVAGAFVHSDAAPASAASAVDGMRGSITYVEACGAAGFAPTGTATLSLSTHDAITGQWSDPGNATWDRTGTVVRVSGGANGIATFAPVGIAACGAPVDVALSGTLAIVG